MSDIDIIWYLVGALAGAAGYIWRGLRARVARLEGQVEAMGAEKADATELHRDYGRLEATVNKAHERIDEMLREK